MDSKVQKKLAKQTNEIGRLTQALEKCAKEKRELLADLRFWKDECQKLADTLAQERAGTKPTF